MAQNYVFSLFLLFNFEQSHPAQNVNMVS